MTSIRIASTRVRRRRPPIQVTSVRLARAVPHVWSDGMWGVVETPYGRTHFVVDKVESTHLHGTGICLDPTGRINASRTFAVTYPISDPTPTTWEQIVEDHALHDARQSRRIRLLDDDSVAARIGRLATRHGVADLAPVAGSDAVRLLVSIERRLDAPSKGTVDARVNALERLAA